MAVAKWSPRAFTRFLLAPALSSFPKLLWIDALCIDQNNDAEKSQQVSMMRRIYRSAIFTTVFLGQSPLPGNQGVASRSIMPFRYDGLRSADQQTQTYFKDAQLTFDLLREFHVLQGNALQDNGMATKCLKD